MGTGYIGVIFSCPFGDVISCTSNLIGIEYNTMLRLERERERSHLYQDPALKGSLVNTSYCVSGFAPEQRLTFDISVRHHYSEVDQVLGW